MTMELIMETEDKREFQEIVGLSFESHGRNPPSSGVLRLWWGVFSPYHIADVRLAFSKALAESQEFLVPAAVKQYLPDRSGFLGCEEAWNQLPKTEFEAGWVYQEIMAAYGACYDSIERGDMIGAMIAFFAFSSNR